MSIEDQVREVMEVKRSEGIVIEKPYTISPNATIEEMLRMSKQYKVKSFLVADEYNHLLGIVTSRDIIFESKSKKFLK